ncbi:MAG: efflux transporter outer membrane subunit [Novosphingobium sp.]|nr:efflux transporter outer membrane subunit [Novosphingobium sp.]
MPLSPKSILSMRALVMPVLTPMLILAGCASVPDPGPRAEPLASAQIAAGHSLAADHVTQRGDWPDDAWWRAFSDPQLDALIDEALRNSPDVSIAVARLRQASGMARAAGAAGLPRVDAQGSVTFNKQSYNQGFPREFLPQGWKDYADLAGVLSFDLDLWGRNRAALAAATSEETAAAIDLAEARIMLASGMAQAYADLARLYEERDVLEAALAVRSGSEKVVTDRSRAGLETAVGTRLASAQTATARADIAAADQAIALRRNQLAALAGAGPDRGLDIARPQLAMPAQASLPPDVTTDLLGRRADIASARTRVGAAAARIRAARADFFPAIRLEALVGLQSLGVENLFRGGSTYGSTGPAISLPIFRGGELQGRYTAARGAYDEAVAQYDKVVLDAYRETADAVTARRQVAVRLAEAKSALADSEGAYRMARLRYDAGLSTYLDVLNVEDRLLQARRAVSGLEAMARDADIALIRALGGGYAPADQVANRMNAGDIVQ